MKCPAFDVVFKLMSAYEITQTAAPTEADAYYVFTFGKSGTEWTIVNPTGKTLSQLYEMKMDGIVNIYDLDLTDRFSVPENRTLNLMGNCTIRTGASMSIVGTCTLETGATLTIEPEADLIIEGSYGEAPGGTCTISDGATLNNNGTIHVGSDDFPNATLNGKVSGNGKVVYPASSPTEET